MAVYLKCVEMKKRCVLFVFSIILGCLLGYAKNTALLIGIGNYNTKSTGWSVIHGNNDVVLLERKLKANGFSVSNLVDSKATKSNIKFALSKLAKTADSGDIIYLHFSGHGQLFTDLNGDEKEGLDQSFVCYDACFSPKYKTSGQSYRGQNHFIDDELFPYLNELKQKVGKSGNVIVIFDTCYSGGADRGSLEDDPDPESEVEWVNDTRGDDEEFDADSYANAYLKTLISPGQYTSGYGCITIISACESDKKNYECKDKRSGRKYGSLSFCLSKLLDKKIPFDQWADYFRNQKYKSMGIFRPSQNPVVESYK